MQHKNFCGTLSAIINLNALANIVDGELALLRLVNKRHLVILYLDNCCEKCEVGGGRGRKRSDLQTRAVHSASLV